MRIIGGIYRSRLIEFPQDESRVRPTKDVVRQAIFNALGNELNDLVVLDLFSGSGAYALESISRGAKKAYAVDNYDLSIKVIKKNISTLKISNISVIQSDYMDFLKASKANGISFDVIFLDPPYMINIYMDVIDFITRNNLLNKYGVIVC